MQNGYDNYSNSSWLCTIKCIKRPRMNILGLFIQWQLFCHHNMVYVTGLELTILTNLLFIINPQGYLPCAKLFVVLDESFILISSDCVFLFWLAGQFLFYTIGAFFSRLIGKPLFNHATIAWFSLYQKKQIAFQRSASYILLVFK